MVDYHLELLNFLGMQLELGMSSLNILTASPLLYLILPHKLRKSGARGVFPFTKESYVACDFDQGSAGSSVECHKNGFVTDTNLSTY